MATVTIGGRELEVWSRKSPGSLGLTKKLIQAEAALADAKGADIPDRIAEVVHCYVGSNEGVTVDWLLSVLPADYGDVIEACVVATGRKVAAPGEAKSP